MYCYKKFWFWATLVAVFAVLILYFLFLAPSAYSLGAVPLQDSQNYNASVYKTLEAQVITDLGYKNSIAGLVRKEGNFYEFGLGPIDNSGGGIEVIAHMKSDGHFEKIWEGQDSPDCYSIMKYGVPVSIAPWCYESVSLDRSNPVRAFFSLFAPIGDIFR